MRDVSATILHTLLAEAALVLQAGGVEEPQREALRIWAGLRQLTPGNAFLQRSAPVDSADAVAFERAVARRAAGEPLAYVTGWAGFRFLTLRSDRRALIPRPETELLVELVLQRVPTGRVADVCTGTGCVALSLAQEGRYAAVLATDLSAGALALARANVALTGRPRRRVRGGRTAPLATDSLDALVANPPYLTEAEHAALEPGVRDWEPRLALPSGDDGLEATRRLLDDGRRVVRTGGWLALETDARRAHEVAALATGLGWQSVTVTRDLFERDRFVLAQRS